MVLLLVALGSIEDAAEADAAPTGGITDGISAWNRLQIASVFHLLCRSIHLGKHHLFFPSLGINSVILNSASTSHIAFKHK